MGMQKHLTYRLQCASCGREFIGRRKDRMYCGYHCRVLASYRLTHTVMPLDGKDSGKQRQAYMPEIVEIPLKGGAVFKVDLDVIQSDEFPTEMVRQLIIDGLGVRLNGGMTKFKVKDLEGEELAEAQEAITARAGENWEALCKGEIKTKKGKSKIPGAVKTRAMQKAKALAKDAIRRAGHKVSAYSAAEIKEMAEEILAADPTIVEEATREIEAQTKKGEEKHIALPAKFAKDDSRKAKPRGKPEAALAAAAKKRKEKAAHATN